MASDLSPYAATCPVCGGGEKETLLAVERAPVSCGQLFATAAEALNAGQCRLEIVFCSGCGHIWNSAHREGPESMYDQEYYSSFTASSQARDYQTRLVQDLDRIVGLRGKTVLEIGCGDGFFLETVGTLGATAIGFEPSSTFEAASARTGIQVYNQLFDFFGTQQGTQKSDKNVDVVVMRHVLEHLPSPSEVLTGLRAAAFKAEPEFLLLEVPNAYHLLKDNLYFDFYNDHIQYFIRPSLERVLKSSGWRPLEFIEPDGEPGGEFIRVVSANSHSSHPVSQQVPATEFLASEFNEEQEVIWLAAQAFRQSYRAWKEQLSKTVSTQTTLGARMAIWGAGSRGVALLAGSELPSNGFAYIVDTDPNKQGKFLPMAPLPIYSQERLRQDPVDCVMVTSYTYFDEIVEQLHWFRSEGRKVLRVYPTPQLVG